MQAISTLKRKGVASMFQFVPWHKLSIVCKIVCYVCSRAKRPAAAAGYKPAPQLGRQIAVCLTYIHTFSKPLIYLSCFIFCYKVIEYQSF